MKWVTQDQMIFFDTNPERLREIRDEVKNDVKTFTGQIAGLKRKKQKTEDEKNEIENIQMQKDLLHNYKNILELYLGSLVYKMGKDEPSEARVFFTLTHINFVTDLNYSVVQFLLVIMV